MKHNLSTRYDLSTDNFYFKYAVDRYDPKIIRAKLFKKGFFEQMAEPIADFRVSAGYGNEERTHHEVINHFESRITLGHLEQYKIKVAEYLKSMEITDTKQLVKMHEDHTLSFGKAIEIDQLLTLFMNYLNQTK